MPRPVFAVVLVLALASCGSTAPRDLSELIVEDSLYVDTTTGMPYSGWVFRAFPGEPHLIQLEGELREGLWEGELVVYHPNGRVRFMGSFVRGKQCGPWTENADSLPSANAYRELVREVESMGIYPPCEGLRDPEE